VQLLYPIAIINIDGSNGRMSIAGFSPKNRTRKTTRHGRKEMELKKGDRNKMTQKEGYDLKERTAGKGKKLRKGKGG